MAFYASISNPRYRPHGCFQCPTKCCGSGRTGWKLHIQCPDSFSKLATDSQHYAKRSEHAGPLQEALVHECQAHVYEAEGNDAQTYLLLYRHADLVIQKLQGHPDKNKPENKRALSTATATVMSDLKRLEDIAPRIKRRHDLYQERRAAQMKALKSLEETNAQYLPQGVDDLSAYDKSLKRRPYDSKPTIDANAQENQHLAARLAQREVKRRDAARRDRQDTDETDLSSQLQEVARLQQDSQRTSYSSVSFF